MTKKTPKNLLRHLLPILFVTACTQDPALRPFSSDGCSLFPDASLFSDKDWCSCCFEHDVAYWRGGTADERLLADQRLKTCVLEKTGNSWLAGMMFSGVRLGGNPYIYSWFRWGYGWPYERKYQSLTDSENALADKLFEDYASSPSGEICEK